MTSNFICMIVTQQTHKVTEDLILDRKSILQV